MLFKQVKYSKWRDFFSTLYGCDTRTELNVWEGLLFYFIFCEKESLHNITSHSIVIDIHRLASRIIILVLKKYCLKWSCGTCSLECLIYEDSMQTFIEQKWYQRSLIRHYRVFVCIRTMILKIEECCHRYEYSNTIICT